MSDEPEVIEAEIVDLDELLEKPLQHPPAVITVTVPAVGPTYRELAEAHCVCGNATDRGHGAIHGRGGLTCDEVLAIAARFKFGRLPFWRRWWTPKPAGWRLTRHEIAQIRDRNRKVRSSR
jgi:hypothetical protein